jgi:short-subunit dehydrogenase involved in D-alanine esterification of teichoic acids
MDDVMDLTGKTVIVTGASSGIGAATARALHAAGAQPALAARRASRLAALSTELGGALAVPTDMTDPAQLHGLVKASGVVVHHPEYVARVVLRMLRTGEDTFDIPHGPEQAGIAEIP